jgi:hypothetical protein
VAATSPTWPAPDTATASGAIFGLLGSWTRGATAGWWLVVSEFSGQLTQWGDRLSGATAGRLQTFKQVIGESAVVQNRIDL